MLNASAEQNSHQPMPLTLAYEPCSQPLSLAAWQPGSRPASERASERASSTPQADSISVSNDYNFKKEWLHGTAQHHAACGTAQHRTAPHSTALHGTAWHSSMFVSQALVLLVLELALLSVLVLAVMSVYHPTLNIYSG